MKRAMFLSLAAQNIRRNRQGYLPYFISCTGLAMMFFVMVVLQRNLAMGLVYGGRTIGRTLLFGQWVMIVFIIIFLFYTQGFLMKRRKKEFGLFNILGMEKRHIARVLAIETLIVGLASTLLGIALGALFSRLFYMILLSALFAKGGWDLVIPPRAVGLSLALFGAMHLLTLLKSVAQVHLRQPIALLRAGRQGETEPPARWLLALLGAGCLGAGYYLSLSTPALSRESLMDGRPINTFFIAVILVILGTYLLFMAGSVTVLKLLKRNKGFYYQPRYFPVVAGLIYRMKRNAVGLASICILSTMVLVMVSATTSLFAGREAALGKRFARQAQISILADRMPENMDEQAMAILREAAAEKGGRLTDLAWFRELPLNLVEEGQPGHYSSEPAARQGNIIEVGATRLVLVPLTDYLRYHPDLSLDPGEALAYVYELPALPDQVRLNGLPITVRHSADRLDPLDSVLQQGASHHTLVLREADIQAIAAGAPESGDVAGNEPVYTHVYAFDHEGLDTQGVDYLMDKGQSRIAGLLMDAGYQGRLSTFSRSEALDRVDMNAVYGGLLFVSVILGAQFILAMVLIIYYKQISEGHEDRESYAMLQKVGMSLPEVRRSISLQVLMVFFLPLVTAGIHLLMSQRITAVVLSLLALEVTPLFSLVALVSYLLFALFYSLVYWKTTRSYYRIIRQSN